jgi:hypothetical protein
MANEKYNGVQFDQADEIPEEGDPELNEALKKYLVGTITADEYNSFVAEKISREETNED